MTTFQKIQMTLAGSNSGRVALHLICLCRDGKLRWHARGIGRELRSAVALGRGSLREIHRCVDHATNLATATEAVSAAYDTVFIRRSAN
jgi:hypothetical protein